MKLSVHTIRCMPRALTLWSMLFLKTILLMGLGLLAFNSATAQSTRFIANGNTVYDRATDLTWQRCAVGQRYFENDCIGSGREMTHAEAQSQQMSGWRLPTRDELTTLIDKSKSFCFMHKVFSEVCDWYWTSEVASGNPERVWNVAFSDGLVHSSHPNNNHLVRLVRSGQ